MQLCCCCRRPVEELQQLVEHPVLREPLRPQEPAMLGHLRQRIRHETLPTEPVQPHSQANVRPSQGVLGVSIEE